jgi:DNA polymerase-3 subunit delta'
VSTVIDRPDVFASLIGQGDAVTTLRRAAAAAAEIVHSGQSSPDMTHAWLFVGPAGSGRSVAARAFAAALQCSDGTGCGMCADCHTVMAGTHADVELVVPEGLFIRTDEARSLVRRAAQAPSGGRWHVVLIEDADRLQERAYNALLKAIEEPAERTVFLLCVPSTHPDDVAITVRSRCRVVSLRSPAAAAVAEALTADGAIDAETALWAAHAAQGHIGRARRLARDGDAQRRRREVLAIPRLLTSLSACFTAAEQLVAAADAEALASLEGVAERETVELQQALGAGGTGKGAAAASRGSAGALKELADRQKSRLTRVKRDALDRALVDLAAFYRDVLTVRFGSGNALVHPDVADIARAAAQKWTAESILHRIEAVLDCRTAIDANVKPRIAVEDMMIRVWKG